MKKDFDHTREITVEVDSKKITGRYVVHGRMVTVMSSYGEKSTQIGGSTPEGVARMLLGELARADQGRVT